MRHYSAGLAAGLRLMLSSAVVRRRFGPSSTFNAFLDDTRAQRSIRERSG
ncbi:hypothetical protein [Amycolatopsis sp. YIM 10]|nr:hypothetical protein [Amycolatopsis sp. YIM 10]QFU90975.1 hypothetical protein YIM_29015 [Amycolatopsis sp. YIM 10]